LAVIDCGGKIKPSDFHVQWHINVSFSFSISFYFSLSLFFLLFMGVVVAGSRGDIYFWRVGLGVVGLKRYEYIFFWESLGSRHY